MGLTLSSFNSILSPLIIFVILIDFFVFFSHRNGEEVLFIIGLLTAKQNTFGDIIFKHAFQNATKASIQFVEDQIYFGQGDIRG